MYTHVYSCTPVPVLGRPLSVSVTPELCGSCMPSWNWKCPKCGSSVARCYCYSTTFELLSTYSSAPRSTNRMPTVVIHGDSIYYVMYFLAYSCMYSLVNSPGPMYSKHRDP